MANVPAAQGDAPLPVAEQWFVRSGCADGVTWLSEPHVDPFARCNIWHVRGRDRDLLIDTGMGLCSLREAAADLFERPLTAVLTHSHFDHIGGAYEFPERLAHALESDELAAPRGFRGLTEAALGPALVQSLRGAGYELPPVLLSALPYAEFRLSDFELRVAPLSGTLSDGDRIDLGDRVFEVLHLPGHSPGSIALWEVHTGILFAGDTIYDGPLLFDLPGSSVPAYARSLERLLELPISVVHAGHDPSFGRSRLREIVADQLARWATTARLG